MAGTNGSSHDDAGKAGGTTPEPPLLAHLDRLMEELHVQAPKALNDWDEEGIHRARVATRRLSAALKLVEPVVGKKRRKQFGRVLRKLRRRLGPLRDADVMRGHLQELAPLAAKHAGAIGWIDGQVGRERDALRDVSAGKGSAAQVLADLGAWHPVREQIAASAGEIDPLLVNSLHLQLDAFVEHAGRIVGGAGGSTGAAHHDPHELRISGKALRYTLEMAVAQGHALPSSVVKTFKRMQEMLGAWHDFVVLTDSAMRLSVEQLLSHRDPTLQEDVLDLARITLRRSAKQLEGFGKLWEAKGAGLAAVIRGAFPLTKPETQGTPETPAAPEHVSEAQGTPATPEAPERVSESETGLDRPGSAGPEVPAVSPPADSSAAS